MHKIVLITKHKGWYKPLLSNTHSSTEPMVSHVFNVVELDVVLWKLVLVRSDLVTLSVGV